MIDEWVDGLIKQQNDTKKQRFCNLQRVSVPKCARPIHTRILPDAKNSRFLDVIESWHELDFTRKQTAKNGGFVCRVLLNLRRVILNFWTIQRVKHMRIVSNSWQLRKKVKL